MSQTIFNSPPHKVINFLHKSRELWRKKAKARSKEHKLLKKRIKFLESSKAQLKDKVKTLKAELLKAKRNNYDKEALKKIRIPVKNASDEESNDNNDSEGDRKKIAVPLTNNSCLTIGGNTQNRVESNLPYHQYSATTMLLNISMILASFTSMRSTPLAIDMVCSFLNIVGPKLKCPLLKVVK